ncbi:hypothetical protein ABBQ32_012235 [Trebouxia sp. C0010 RCD-2024]
MSEPQVDHTLPTSTFPHQPYGPQQRQGVQQDQERTGALGAEEKEGGKRRGKGKRSRGAKGLGARHKGVMDPQIAHALGVNSQDGKRSKAVIASAAKRDQQWAPGPSHSCLAALPTAARPMNLVTLVPAPRSGWAWGVQEALQVTHDDNR